MKKILVTLVSLVSCTFAPRILKYKRMDANLIFTVALAAAIVLICKFANETQNKL